MHKLICSSVMVRVQVYYDPLTRKKFMSRNAYLNTVSSKKYKDTVRKSGQPAPEPIVRTVTQGLPASAQGGVCCPCMGPTVSYHRHSHNHRACLHCDVAAAGSRTSTEGLNLAT